MSEYSGAGFLQPLVSMNSIAAYLIGPEIVWALMYFVTLFLAARNQPPTEAGNQQLELIGWCLPVLGVLLSFIPLAWAPGNRWLWLARIIVAGTIGVIVVTGRLCSGIDYHDSRNSGVGTAYVMFIMLGLMTLGVAGVLAAVYFLTKWRFLPFLK